MKKQLLEEMVKKVIVEAKGALHKVDQKQPGGDTSGDRPVMDSLISSASITIGAVTQQIQDVYDISHLLVCLHSSNLLVCLFPFFFFFFYKTNQKSHLLIFGPKIEFTLV